MLQCVLSAIPENSEVGTFSENFIEQKIKRKTNSNAFQIKSGILH